MQPVWKMVKVLRSYGKQHEHEQQEQQHMSYYIKVQGEKQYIVCVYTVLPPRIEGAFRRLCVPLCANCGKPSTKRSQLLS